MDYQAERNYLGTVISSENYKEILEKGGRKAINFHNKHLKRYKQGRDSYHYGSEVDEKGDRKPLIYNVQQRITFSFDNEQGKPQIRTFRSQREMNSYLQKKAQEKKDKEKFGKSK